MLPTEQNFTLGQEQKTTMANKKKKNTSIAGAIQLTVALTAVGVLATYITGDSALLGLITFGLVVGWLAIGSITN